MNYNLQWIKRIISVPKIVLVFILLVFPFVIIVTLIILTFIFSRIPAPQVIFKNIKCHNLYIHSNGVHTEIVIHKTKMNPWLTEQLNTSEKHEFISLGWGDESLMILHTPQWSDLNAFTAFKSLFLPTDSIIHVTPYKKVSEKWKVQLIGDQQLDILNKYIESTFTTKNFKVAKINFINTTSNVSFYKASPNYHVLYNCNSWVNDLFKKIGIKTSIWSLANWGIFYFLKKSNNYKV